MLVSIESQIFSLWKSNTTEDLLCLSARGTKAERRRRADEMTRKLWIEFSNLVLSQPFHCGMAKRVSSTTRNNFTKRIANTLNHWIKVNRSYPTNEMKLGIYANRMRHTEFFMGQRLSPLELTGLSRERRERKKVLWTAENWLELSLSCVCWWKI